jgi:uncharacterized protein (TIGR03067 family)
MSTVTCPNREELSAYVLGRLSEEALETVASHLEGCTQCAAALADVDDSDDTLVARLRRGLAAAPYLEEPQCQVAVSRARQLKQKQPSTGQAGPSLCGQTWGEYQLLEELGHGGMGTVYKALHTKLDRVVALKVLTIGRTQDPRAIARFGREMKAVGKLDHRHIVRAHDAREIDGMPMLVMEYIEGLDLGEILRRSGPLGVPEACELARQTAVGLQYVHEHGLVHRDIKPSNVMLTPQGEVKILDLGLARFHFDQVLDTEGSGSGPMVAAEMTTTNQAMGTIDYMAPEQVANCRTVDIRADLYSLGCTLYKLLTGRASLVDLQHHKLQEKLQRRASEPITPIRQLRPDVPEPLAAILDRLLAPAATDRYATPAEAATALAPWCAGADLPALLRRASGSLAPNESAVARPAQTEDSVHKPRPLAGWAGRKRILYAAIGLALFGSIGLAFGILIHLKKDNKTTTIEVPEGSTARVDTQGAVTLELPSAPPPAIGFLPSQPIPSPSGASTYYADPIKRDAALNGQPIPPPLLCGPGATNYPVPTVSGPAWGSTYPMFYAPAPRPSVPSEIDPVHDQWNVVRIEKGKDGDAAWAKILGRGTPPLATVYRFVLCDTDDEDHLLIPMSRSPLERQPDKGLPAPLAYGPFPMCVLCYRRNVYDSPKTMDFRTYRPALKGAVGNLTGLGIYEVDGDHLKICLRAAPSGQGNRPKSFQIQPESGDILFVLERHRPSEDERAFNSLYMWTIVELIRNGKPTPPDEISFLQRSVDMDWISINRAPGAAPRNPGTAPGNSAPTKVMTHPLALDFAEARFVLDATNRPKRLTLFPLVISADDNENDGRFFRWAEPLYGIYEFEGDRLRIAYRKGQPPEKFESPPGSSVTLLLLQTLSSAAPLPALPPAPYGAAKARVDRAWEIEVFGLQLVPIAKESFRQQFPRSRFQGGMKVVAVRPNSDASRQGLRQGDVLVALNGGETTSTEKVIEILHGPELLTIHPLTFLTIRNGEMLFGFLRTAGEGPDWALAMFDHTSHNFGVVPPGERREHRFVVTNIYREDQRIASVSVADGFTAGFDRHLLKTGEKANIIITVDGHRFLGRRSRRITVTLDRPFLAQVMLEVAADVREARDQSANTSHAAGRADAPIIITAKDGQVVVTAPGGQVTTEQIEIFLDRKKSKAETQASALEFRILVNHHDHEPIIRRAFRDLAGNEILDPAGKKLAWWAPVKPGREAEFRHDPEIVMRTRKERDRDVHDVLVANDPYNVTGKYLARATAARDNNGRPRIEFALDEKGGELFSRLTGDNRPDRTTGFARRLGILVAGKLYSAPRIFSVIRDRGEISGSFTEEEAKKVAELLNAGRQQGASLCKAPNAMRAESLQNLKQLALAMRKYLEDKGCFPPAVLYGPDGNTPYSWRVALLPCLQHSDLYGRYRVTEPWDSPNNRRVLEKMPAVFRCPGSPADSHSTAYFALVGPDTIFSGTKGTTLMDITDGTSPTVLLVEAKRDVPWTKPEDIAYDARKPLPQLGGCVADGFCAAMADFTVRVLPSTIPEKLLRALITKAGGEVVENKDLPPAE